MNARAIITALLAYGRAERELGEGTGGYAEVDAALDSLLLKLWPTPPTPFARQCSWCQTYASPEDEALARAGAQVTHGICGVCSARLDEQADAMDRQVVR